MRVPRQVSWGRVVVVGALCVAAHASGDRSRANAQPAPSPLVAAAKRVPAGRTSGEPSTTGVGVALGQAHEQEWIVADILTTMHRLARGGEPPPRLRVETEAGGWSQGVVIDGRAPARLEIIDHVWSPNTYLPAARHLISGQSAPAQAEQENLAVRSALVDLRVTSIMAQDRAVSARLREQPRSAAAHESAALVVGAFALREGLDIFADTRRDLSLMTAHLAMAKALRGSGGGSRDGHLARAIHAALAGLQREALASLERLDTPDASAEDRAWVRALTLRITGDWRAAVPPATATRLEQFEHARALATRVGSAALMDWLETFEQDADPVWHRIALGHHSGMFTLEASANYSGVALDRETAEARHVWSSLHQGRVLTDPLLVAALNETEAGTAGRASGDDGVLPWARWAASAQRHVAAALTARAYYHHQRADPDAGRQHVADSTAGFAGLTLFPLVLRSIALDAATYGRSMTDARRLVAAHPEIVTAAVWNLLTERPTFEAPLERFPVLQAWMFPIVPTGSAFDLYARSLQPNCPRTPPAEQAGLWAQAQPYDQWTVWAAQWLPATGAPKPAAVIKAYGALLDYDANANRLVTFHLALSHEQNLLVAQRLCALSAECGRYAWLLLWDGRDEEAAAAYEDWMRRSRDRLGPANDLAWLARHYVRTGRKDDARRVARFAAGPGSSRGLVTLAETLTSLGAPEEGLEIYKEVAERYRERVPLGTHRLRMALQRGTRDDQLAAMTDLQAVFPHGLEPLVLAGLDAVPKDGVSFGPLGRRATQIGVRAGDIVVGLDEWRVRNWEQYGVVLDLRHQREAVTLTVYRNGRYQQLPLRMPERKLAVALENVARQR